MKYFISIFLLFTSASTSACIDISGKYSCIKDGVDDITFKKIKDTFLMNFSGEDTLFEIGKWSPSIDPATGVLDYNIHTMASCKSDTVILHANFTENHDGMSVTFPTQYEVKLTSKGVNIRRTFEGEEMLNINCSKK